MTLKKEIKRVFLKIHQTDDWTERSYHVNSHLQSQILKSVKSNEFIITFMVIQLNLNLYYKITDLLQMHTKRIGKLGHIIFSY